MSQSLESFTIIQHMFNSQYGHYHHGHYIAGKAVRNVLTSTPVTQTS